MYITLSENRLTDLIQQLENINDTADEILFRAQHYFGRLFSYLSETYGIKMIDRGAEQGTVASFKFDISGTKDYATDECWEKLLSGLSWLNPVAVSVEQSDMRVICSGLVAAAMVEQWGEYGGALQRLSVAEIRPTIEAWLQRIVWSGPLNVRPDYRGLASDETGDSIVNEIKFQNALLAEGITDPLKNVHAVDEYNFNEEQAAAKAENARKQQLWASFNK